MNYIRCVVFQFRKFSRWNDSPYMYLHIISDKSGYKYFMTNKFHHIDTISLPSYLLNITLLDDYILPYFSVSGDHYGIKEEDEMFLSQIKREMNINKIVSI